MAREDVERYGELEEQLERVLDALEAATAEVRAYLMAAAEQRSEQGDG